MPSEINLAPADALRDGEMRTYPATPETEVLLVRRQGQYRALAARCPHYGAPLEKGRIINDQIVCPWHHACFRVDDGHLCQPPALDDLPTYPVRVADGRVWVTLPRHPTASAESPDATPTALVGGNPPAPDRAAPDQRTFVIVGAGAAGQFAAQTLRAEGFGGRLVLVGADPAAPYDRTKLSKAYLVGKADKSALPLRKPAFYEQHQIEVLTDTRATGLNLADQLLTLTGRDPLRYDKLLLAPGSQPNTLPKLPGHELAGVLPLRTAQDATRIREAAAAARHVIIIGSSFIGMEAAASLAAENEAQATQERRVTVLARDKEPFEKSLGPKIGAMFRNLHRRHGVRFKAEVEVEALEGENGRVTAVRLASGQRLPADLVVLGVGVQPTTGFLAEAFELDKDGGLRVDSHLQAAENVYAAGDAARFPLAAGLGQHRIEHWRLAQQHGACAARNMLGQEVAFAEVPFFWTQQYGKSLRYAGHAPEWDEIIFHGDVRRQNFLALYAHRNRLIAAAGMGRDDDMMIIEALFRHDQMPTPTAARRKTDWAKLLGR
ncbi:FAD-dependent oxidoreductase [Hymenobacter psychrophilus]|uniref:NADPH-dependent 2,4-dienoyl-CoA reductase, sulfur reductase n=1 Tax=Hymenobacter psychrophilus TaxID=651662 RepID=A0A1H3HZ84_9BACT|nr:FAD-dependent oxidoreductase [Hymenobacter psychrophilus]SDY20128.1 NADPH-dependent 2,4-dienoyl-CoA reductase, sulfur reductase [Hymenobacter psychrophilus]